MVTAPPPRKSSIYHRPCRSLHDPLPGMSSSSTVPKYSIAINRKVVTEEAPLIILEQHHSSFINNNTKTSSSSSTIFELSKLEDKKASLPPAQRTSSSSLASEPSSRALSGESSSLPSSWGYPGALSYCYDYEEDYHYGRSCFSSVSSTTAVEENEEMKEEDIRKYGPSPPCPIGFVRTHHGMRRASLHFQDLQSLRNEKRCS